MRHLLSRATAVLCLLGACAGAFGQIAPEPVPDEAATRQSVDQLINDFKAGKKPATVGLIQEAANRSIAFGAPAWNRGDHDACCRFYLKTVESLCAAFPDDKAATPSARPLLHKMGDALARVRQSHDVDSNAWSLRYTFDAAQLESSLAAVRISGATQLGSQCMLHGSYPEAQASFEEACAALDDLDGMDRTTIAPPNRFAPLALSNALFAQGRYKEAAQAIVRGLKLLPRWPTSGFDPRPLFGAPGTYHLMLRDLEAKAQRLGDDANVQFLLGYHYYFTGRRDKALDQFKKTLKLDPAHAGARAFLDALTPQTQPHQRSRAPKAPTV